MYTTVQQCYYKNVTIQTTFFLIEFCIKCYLLCSEYPSNEEPFLTCSTVLYFLFVPTITIFLPNITSVSLLLTSEATCYKPPVKPSRVY